MSERTYLYRREDTGEVVERPFASVMQQDAAGYIVLEDGVEARRCWHLEKQRDGFGIPKVVADTAPMSKPVVSDSLGFTREQLADFETDRVANGFKDIEFHQDPTEPTFVQVHAGSRKALMRYARHRGMVDLSTRASPYLSQEELDRAAQLVERVHGKDA